MTHMLLVTTLSHLRAQQEVGIGYILAACVNGIMTSTGLLFSVRNSQFCSRGTHPFINVMSNKSEENENLELVI